MSSKEVVVAGVEVGGGCAINGGGGLLLHCR